MQVNDIPVLFSADEIKERITSISCEIGLKMPPDLMLVSLLKGSFVFTADLIRALCGIGMHPQVDFMTLSSYGIGRESSRTITINRDLSEEVKGRNILIV